jgi:hypothetical protein
MSARSPRPDRPPHGAAGFTLVELMVASGAAMVLLAATFTLMGSIFDSNSTMTLVLETQHKVRVALNELAREVTRAGTGISSAGITIPNGNNSSAIPRAGSGLGLGNLATPNNVLSILVPGDGVGPTISGVATDAITVVTVDQTSPNWTIDGITPAGNNVDWIEDISTGAYQQFLGDLLLFTNVNASVFGQITNVQTSGNNNSSIFASSDPLNFNQPSAANGNINALANPGNPVTWPPTTATRIRIMTYYLDNTDAAHPKLMRKINSAASQVVAEDIYNLQFSYDLFDFDNNVDTANQSTTASPNQIRAVSIAIDGRSSDLNTRTGDYYRFGLVSKVNVRNATFRNRYDGG